MIIFDEIQKFPKAREAVKYLVADGRYDYLETGSLISIRENVKDITIPSEETKIKMYPLDDSMICNLCYKCNDPNVGFSLHKNEAAVKCYMGDTGLLVSLAFGENELASQQLYKMIMNGRLTLNEGMLYENCISQMIAAKGKKLFFYTRYNESKHRNDIEIDFLLSNESKTSFKIFPVEVKSSKNYTATSLTRFAEVFSPRIAQSYIIHPKPFVNDGTLTKIPPYMLFCAL